MAVNLAPASDLLTVAGVQLATAHAGLRRGERDDVTLISFAPGTRAAAVFTQSAFAAAPVIVARENLRLEAPRAFIINAGNANAATGRRGLEAARATCRHAGELLGIPAASVLPFSTGVIGELLPAEKVNAAVGVASQRLEAAGWEGAAAAIMTTDTVSKGCSATARVGGRTITVTGISKGAGMICPDMATMLAYVATDAEAQPEVLDAVLRRVNARTFNAITVDGDTSTNDAVVLAATGASGVKIEHGDAAAVAAFEAAVEKVMEYLATAIVRDAEGATKFITIEVDGARTEAEARQVAYTIAHSPLVKTAMYASDANVGRLFMAIGRAGVPDLDIERLEVWLGDVLLGAGGGVADGYTEAAGAAVVAQAEIQLRVLLGRGEAAVRIWTSDLSHDYVTINAEYRT